MMIDRECCGKRVATPFCPLCGKKTYPATDPLALLNYLKSHRNKTAAWVKRTEREIGAMSVAEQTRRREAHLARLEMWDAWIRWVEENRPREE
jgi:hypothetical protein